MQIQRLAIGVGLPVLQSNISIYISSDLKRSYHYVVQWVKLACFGTLSAMLLGVSSFQCVYILSKASIPQLVKYIYPILTALLCRYAVFMVAVIPGLIGLEPEVNEINRYYPNSGFVNIAVVHFFFFLTMLCFVLTSVRDPGGVPSLFPWDPECLIPMEEDHADFRGIERKADGRPRYIFVHVYACQWIYLQLEKY